MSGGRPKGSARKRANNEHWIFVTMRMSETMVKELNAEACALSAQHKIKFYKSDIIRMALKHYAHCKHAHYAKRHD